MNKKALEASYMVSYRIAQTGKPHTIMEEFFLPSAADAVGVMLGERQKVSYRPYRHQTTPFLGALVPWLGTFSNTYCFAYEPVNFINYSLMSQRTWPAWRSS
ncbi:Uncharacterized protein FKW44_007647 [Caligus rogercresseyi]|uniref:Uncharacterized protein n=1 Tax=Caligus rogercresseyi TaxID=217165 RepID=A0A7T8QTR2_CALRO|nr:Uncharacterized protein FKW44_007647 [Caligus rogercresseyi]